MMKAVTPQSDLDHKHQADALSPRERQILVMVAYEYTTCMIAKELSISTHTVISHRKNIMIKLGVRNSAGLVRRGFELGLCSPQPA